MRRRCGEVRSASTMPTPAGSGADRGNGGRWPSALRPAAAAREPVPPSMAAALAWLPRSSSSRPSTPSYHTKAFLWDQLATAAQYEDGKTPSRCRSSACRRSTSKSSTTMVLNTTRLTSSTSTPTRPVAKDDLSYNLQINGAVRLGLSPTSAQRVRRVRAPTRGKMNGTPQTCPRRGPCSTTRTLFKDAGIAEPPKTWAEFEADAKKVTDPRQGQHRLRPAAGTGGGPGRVLHLAVQQRR